MIRIYYPVELNIDDVLVLKDSLAHRIIHVMRSKVNEEFFLFNGQSGDSIVQILKLTSKEVTIKIKKQLPAFPSSPLYTHLIQGISRPDRMDYSLQKATECGVNRITPLITQYSQHLSKSHYEKKMQHWKSILISAAEQCYRSDIPILDDPISFQDFVSSSSFTDEFTLIFDPNSPQTLRNLSSHIKKISFMIGPEGGFSAEEVEIAIQKGAIALSLGSRILRTETVAPVVLGCLQYLYGDLG